MEKLSLLLVLEILGKPAEHIKKALETLVEKLGSENGVNLIKKQLHEPAKVEDSKTLFTTFAEIELEMDSTEILFAILFSYMPAHVEILSPQKISFQNTDLNELTNALLVRLHNYDAVSKKLLMEKNQLLKKLKEVAPDLFKHEQDTKEPSQ